MSATFKAIGLMSGTSMDGIDVALIETDGETTVRRGPAAEYPYTPAFRRRLAASLEDAKAIRERGDRPGSLAEVEREITGLHGDAVQRFLSDNGLAARDIAVVGFHGQTVIHRPDQGYTVQIGGGPLLAKQIGIPVVYDMRANDMAHGGQGAPLVPAYHAALAQSLDRAAFPVVFVNIGGISNLTYIGADGEIVAYDSGPGNTLIDQWVEAEAGIPFDQGGAIASEGQVIATLAERYMAHPFFTAEKRRSLDRNDFRPPKPHEAGLHDGARTLAHVTAAAILKSARHLPQRPRTYIICGGGRLNRTIVYDLRRMAAEEGAVVDIAEAFGFDGSGMEAEAWAYLAVRSIRGLPLTFPGTTGVKMPVTGGVLIRPAARLVGLTTARLMLSPWEDGDEALLLALHATPETSRYVGNNKPWTPDYALTRLEQWRAAHHAGEATQYKILARDDGRFLGRAGLNWYPEAGLYQLNYSIVREEWGKGFAREIASGLCGWFFDNSLGERLQAFAHEDNSASIRVLRRIGMQEMQGRLVNGSPCRFFEMTKPFAAPA